MAFDPSTIADIGGNTPDVPGSIAKGFQLKDLADTTQLNTLRLNSEKQSLADNEKYKSILASSDLSTDKGRASAQESLTKAKLPDRAMELGKYSQQVKSGELQEKLGKIELHSAAQDIITGGIDKIWQQATAMKNEKTADGRPKYTDTAINAWIQGQVPLAVSGIQSDSGLPEDVKKMALGDINQKLSQSGGQITYDQLTAFERGSKQGQAQIKSYRDDLLAQTGAKKEEVAERHEGETERHNRVSEDLANKRTTGGGTQDQQVSRGDLLAALGVAGVNLPQRNKQALNDTLDGLYRKYPNKSADEIAQGIKSGQLTMSAEKTEASVLGRREAAILPVEKSITKPGGFLDQAEQAVNNVDFSKLKAAGAFESWTKDQASDPQLTAYKAAVAELRAEYSIVLSKGGQVTDAARQESTKVIPDLITKEQFKSIRKTVQRGIEASKSGVEESISGVEGKTASTGKDNNDPLGIR